MHTTEQLNAALAGRYVIERRVGEGGMATVYLARDAKHNRRVALKVLKPDLGAIVGVERFLSEIEVTANLQHPNLLPLFDSGAADGLLFYVMPFIEGESLRARIDREKQLPIDDALRIATAVASALDYAHRRGVIHRDLKPENILLHEGQPLVADFGIALAVSNAGGNRVTQTGLSLGTPQYMSPEQATGDRAIDARTDIYSLGAVTYEMLTGEPPHTGSTSQAIIARVLTERPRSLRSSRPNVPVHVEATVDQALEKLAADRFASAREFSEALTGARPVTLAGRTTDTVRVTGRPSRERALAVALGITVLLATTLGALALKGRAIPLAQPEVRFVIETPPTTSSYQISMSPDGQTVAYTGIVDGVRQLWGRSLSSTVPRPIATLEGPNGLSFWSADSRYVAIVSNNAIKRVPLDGGPMETMYDSAYSIRGGSWNARDVVIFSQGGRIHRVAAQGGPAVEVPLDVDGASEWEQPWFLPDGEHFVVLARRGSDAVRGVYLASLDGGKAVRVTAGYTRVAFAPPDQLLFMRENALYAQRLNVGSGQLEGEAVRIADEVGLNPVNGNVGFGVSNTGALVTRAIGGVSGRRLRWYTRSGAAGAFVGDTASFSEHALAPNGRYIASTRFVSSASQVNTIWLTDLSTGIASPLVTRREAVSGALWSPDSRSVTYRVADTLFSRAVGGTRDSVVYIGQGTARAEDYTRDGRTLLLRHAASTRVLAATVGGSDPPRGLGSLGAVDELRLSPDGRTVSYNTNGPEVAQVWVASFPALDNRRQVSANGGVQARWRADGRELLFLTQDGKVMSAAVTPGAVPEFGTPQVLFQGPDLRPSAVSDQWDFTPDGQRFVFAERLSGPEETPPLTVVLNWTSALRRR